MLRTYTDPLASSEELSAQYDEERDDNLDTGAFAGGVESGWYGLRSSLNNALAAGGRILGADQFAQNRERAADVLQQRAAGAGHMLPKFEELSGPGDVGTWAAGITGQNLPLLAVMAGSGVAGGAAGAALLRRAGLAKSIGRAVGADELLNAKRAMLPDDIAQLMSAKASKEAEEIALNRSMTSNIAGQAFATDPRGLAARVGGLSGVIAPYFGTTAGDTYSGLRQDPDAVGTLEEKAKAAALSGAAQTSIGTLFEPLIGVVPRAIHKRLAKSPLTGTKAGLAELGIASLGEGMTETGEQAIQQYTQNQFNPNAGYNPMQLLEAGLAGALVGGVYSAPNAIQTALKKAPPSPTDTPDVTDSIPNRIERISTAFSNLDPQSPSYGSDRAVLLATQANLLSEHKDKLGLSTEYLSGIKKQLDDEITSLGPEPAPNSQYHEAWTRKRDLLTMGKASITASLVSSMPGGEAMANEPEDDGSPPEPPPIDDSFFEGLISGNEPEAGPEDSVEKANKRWQELFSDPEVEAAIGAIEEGTQVGPPLNYEELAAYDITPASAEDTLEALVAKLNVIKSKAAVERLNKTGNEEGFNNEAEAIKQHIKEKVAVLRQAEPNILSNYIREDGTGPVKVSPTDQTTNIILAGKEGSVDASSAVRDAIVGVLPGSHTPFVNMQSVYQSIENKPELIKKLNDVLGLELEILGVSPAKFLDVISNPKFGKPNKTVNVSNFLYSYLQNSAIDSQAKGFGLRSAAIINSLTPEQIEEAGLNKEEAVDALTTHIHVQEDPTSRYQKVSVNSKYDKIIDTATGDDVIYPKNIISGYINKQPFIFRGTAITSDKVIDIVLDAFENNREISPATIMNAARHGYEFRREDRVRPTFEVSFDEVEGLKRVATEPTMGLRLTPLQKEFGIVATKLRARDPDIFAMGKAAFIRHMEKEKGLVLVGSMDNNLFFATPKDSIALFEKFNLEDKLHTDMNLIERIGTIIKKQSGETEVVDLSVFQEHPEWSHNDKTHDGLMVRAPGVHLAQGVGLRVMKKPNGEEYYEVDKGMMRGLLANVFYGEPFINDKGEEDLKDFQRLTGEGNEENPSLNTNLQFGFARDMSKIGENLKMLVNRMFPPAIQKGGKANLQQLLFSFLDPLSFMRRDRLNRFSDPDPINQLKGLNKLLVKLGIPPARLLKREEIYGKNTSFAAHTARAYTLSSELVNPGEVKLLKKTYLEINKAYKKTHGRNLREGDNVPPEQLQLIIHRDPSLSDASSMGKYTFAGIMALDTGDVERGIVVNPNDKLWKEAAGDFDGDSGVVMLPDPLVQEKTTVLPASEEILSEDERLSFVKTGTSKLDPSDLGDKLLDSRKKLAAGNLSENERAELLKTDPINRHVADAASGYSQMMGPIMATAQRVSELGLEGLQVQVPTIKNGQIQRYEDGKPITKYLPIMYVLAKLGQGSVSAKKKATHSELAMEIFDGIRKQVNRASPDLQDPVTGRGIVDEEATARVREKYPEAGPIFFKERGFNAYFRDVAKAPVDPSEVPNKELAQRFNVSRATRVMQQLLMYYEPLHMATPEQLEKFEDMRRDLKAHINMFNAEHGNNYELPENANLRDIIREWDNINSEEQYVDTKGNAAGSPILGTPRKVYEYLTALMSENPTFTNPRSPFRNLLARRPLTVELALRAIAVNEAIEVLGALDTRRDIPAVFKQGAKLFLEGGMHSAGMDLATKYRVEYNKLASALDDIDKDEDEDAWDAAHAKLTRLNREIRAVYRTGQITPYEMIANGPPQTAVNLVKPEYWQNALDAVAENPEVPLNIPVTGFRNNEEIKPSEIRDGVYFYDKNTKELKLVKGFNKDSDFAKLVPQLLANEDIIPEDLETKDYTGEFVKYFKDMLANPGAEPDVDFSARDYTEDLIFEDDVLRRATQPTIASESNWSRLNVERFILPRAESTGFVIISKPKDVSAKGTKSAGVDIEQLTPAAFEEMIAKYDIENVFRAEYDAKEAAKKDVQFVDHMYLNATEAAGSDFTLAKEVKAGTNPRFPEGWASDTLTIERALTNPGDTTDLSQRYMYKEGTRTPYEWLTRVDKPNKDKGWSSPTGLATLKAKLTPNVDGTDRFAYLLVTGVRHGPKGSGRIFPTVMYLGDNLDSANEFLHQWKIDNGHITPKEVPSQNKTWAQQEATITDGQVQTVLNYPGWDALLAFHNDPDLTDDQKTALDVELRRVVKRVMAGVKTVKEYTGDRANIEQDTGIKPIYLTMDRAKALETIKVWLANEILKLKRGNGGSNTGGTAPPSSPTPPAPPAQAAPTSDLTDKEANEGYTVTGLTVDSSGTFNYVVEQTLATAVPNATKAQYIRTRVLENAGILDRIGRRAKTVEDKKAYERALADYKKYSTYGNSVADGLAPRNGREGLNFTEQKPAWLTLNKEIVDKIGKMSIPELRKFIHNQLKRADAEDAASAAVNGRVKNIAGVMRDEAYAAQRRLNILTNRPENENLPTTLEEPYDEASPNEPGPTNEVPGPSSLTDEEHLASISNPAIQDRLQNTASSWATLMGTSPIKLVSAKEMYDYLINRNQGRDAEIAAKILLHAKGAKFKTGVSGVHVTSSDGTHWIYVSTKGATEEDATNQAAILAHEFGHTIAMKGFSELKANNKILAAQVEKAWKQFAKQKGYAKEGSPSYDEAVNQARFNEWLADNIGTWMLTDMKPRNAVQSWFKDMADKFMRAWNFVSMALTRVTRGKMKRLNTKTGDAEVPVSIKEWMDSLAKPSEYIEYLAGPDSTTESLKDRMDRRAAVLKNWAAGTGLASVELINEMVPYIKNNLNNLLGVADANMLRRNAFSPAMRKRLVHLLGTNTKAAQDIEENADSAVAYLWALSTWGILKPSGEERTALNKIQQMLKYKNRVLLEATDDEMDDIISRLNNPAVKTNVNDLIIPPDSPAARLYKTMDKRYKDGVFGAVQRAGQTYKKMFGWYIDEPYMRILNTGNPTLIEFAKLIQPMAYELGGLKRAGMVERTRAFYQLFAQHAAEILTPLSEQEQGQLADVLYNTPNTRIDQLPASVQKAAKSIRHLLDRIFDYEVDNGVDINKRDRYWPMILNHEYITQNLDAVLALYSHAQFMPGWFGVKEDYKKWIEDELVDADIAQLDTAKRQIDMMWARDPKEFIKFYITNDGRRLLPGHALNQLEFGRVHTPGFRFMNPRELDFLLTAEDQATGMRDEDLHRRIVGTLEPDLSRVLQRYIRSAAKRAEHSHLLRKVGGKEGIKGFVEKALAEPGAEAKDVQLALDYLTAVQGMLGLKERDWIDEHIEKWTKGDKDHWMADYHSGKARVMNDNIQNANSWIMAWTNISHLTLAFAAASADPLTQLAHHGDYKIFMQSFKETVDAIRGAVKTASAAELEQMIDWVGTEERSMSRQDIEATHASNYMSRVPAKIMDTFFRWNGVESITELSRGMSSRAAFHALAGWAKTARESTDPAEVEKATARLHEHGITPEDVVLTQEGNIKIMPFAEHFDATKEEQERDIRVRAAIHRFVDESTIRPDPTNRSLFMSNPYFAILTQWKPFVVAFNTQILRPAWARMVEQGDATPIAYLALSTIPMLLFMDAVRDAVKMAFSDDEDREGNKKLRPAWKSSWSLSDHVLYATERAGFLGNHELVAKIIKPITEGKVPEALTELGGVVTSDLRKMAQWGVGQSPYPLKDLTSQWGDRHSPRFQEDVPEQTQVAR